ncbi:Triacylglycerol lipase [Saliniradius amylolyticus]|uniref:Triacylglycerol lipase n=1 Tax=Saliniradius amylolyticus TaxID=2183582 RepID=A0A2S2E2A2_9ALTE|nr:VolA/Pla-1 family phospholipase [Saliniradius amylolyticus]AWL11768.1 Triacylglycerol lipase [Saliniradius amylolyticus]
MKKLVLSATIATVLGLTGCGGGETLEELQNEAEQSPTPPTSRIVFDPAASNLNVPNDLLMIPNGDLFDFTINTVSVAEFDPGNPQHALSALDGWSTQHPFTININVPEGSSLNEDTLMDAIHIYEATQALEGESQICQGIAAEAGAPGLPCELGDELVYGVDYVAQMPDPSSGTINVVPLKPLKSGQGYVLAMTESLRDSAGNAVKGSTTWDLVKQDPEVNPLATPDQLQLQGIVNTFIPLLEDRGLVRERVSYAAYFSTQSTGEVLSTIRKMEIGEYAQTLQGALGQGLPLQQAQAAAAGTLPEVTASVAAGSVYPQILQVSLPADQLAGIQAAGLDNCSNLFTAAGAGDPTAGQLVGQFGAFCAADLAVGSASLPYYSSADMPMDQWWRAACTSGAMLQAMGQEQVTQLIAAGAVGENNALCQALSDGQLFDLNLSAVGIDDPRHLTKYNPIPEQQSVQDVPVQYTVPNLAFQNMVAASTPGLEPIAAMPENGWPVVILQHGITSKKEDMLAMTGALSLFGFATVAIDHPLHGERGFGQVNATTGSATAYMNLANLLVTRDNLRQSIADTLALRLGLNALNDATGQVTINPNAVSYVGHSLGGITGTAALAIANSELDGQLADFASMTAMESATLAMPGGGIAGFLLDSPTFGPVVKGSLLAASSEDFQQALQAYMVENGLTDPVSAAAQFYPLFEQSLSGAQKAEIESTFAGFAFAAQTVVDAADPNNYAATVAENTNVHLIEVVGDGSEQNLPDQVIPNSTSLPLAGTEPLIQLLGLPNIVSTTVGEGAVRFNQGGHSSLLDPSSSAAATSEMQTQVGAFLSNGAIVISNEAVIAQ